MNHPRCVRLRRLLLLVPLALLGAAWLARARSPRPQTEGDKWLWEQAEKVPRLDVDFQSMPEPEFVTKLGLEEYQHIVITDRQGIREVLRSFKGTPKFTLSSHPDHYIDGQTIICFSDRGPFGGALFLGRGDDDKYYLSNDKGRVPTDSGSLIRYYAALQKAVSKARHKQTGYSTYTGGE